MSNQELIKRLYQLRGDHDLVQSERETIAWAIAKLFRLDAAYYCQPPSPDQRSR
jgi:hypothetical protein